MDHEEVVYTKNECTPVYFFWQDSDTFDASFKLRSTLKRGVENVFIEEIDYSKEQLENTFDMAFQATRESRLSWITQNRTKKAEKVSNKDLKSKKCISLLQIKAKKLLDAYEGGEVRPAALAKISGLGKATAARYLSTLKITGGLPVNISSMRREEKIKTLENTLQIFSSIHPFYTAGDCVRELRANKISCSRRFAARYLRRKGKRWMKLIRFATKKKLLSHSENQYLRRILCFYAEYINRFPEVEVLWIDEIKLPIHQIPNFCWKSPKEPTPVRTSG